MFVPVCSNDYIYFDMPQSLCCDVFVSIATYGFVVNVDKDLHKQSIMTLIVDDNNECNVSVFKIC